MSLKKNTAPFPIHSKFKAFWKEEIDSQVKAFNFCIKNTDIDFGLKIVVSSFLKEQRYTIIRERKNSKTNK